MKDVGKGAEIVGPAVVGTVNPEAGSILKSAIGAASNEFDKGDEVFTFIIQMVLTVLVSSVKNPANVTATEWTLVQQLQDACTLLLAQKPAA